MLFTEQFPEHRAAEIANAVKRGARFIEAMLLGEDERREWRDFILYMFIHMLY